MLTTGPPTVSEEGSGGSTGLELAVLAGMVLLAFPIYRTVVRFLEADMGTESIASVARVPRDIRQKIINYQQYFQNGKHKVYEKLLDCRLKGFRLLFLTNTGTRLGSLCKLMQRMPPTDFIWLTTAEQMLSHGLSAKIWARGGRQEAPEESILGTKIACNAPLLPLKK